MTWCFNRSPRSLCHSTWHNVLIYVNKNLLLIGKAICMIYTSANRLAFKPYSKRSHLVSLANQIVLLALVITLVLLPLGKSMPPHLLCCQGLEVDDYSFAIGRL